MPTIADDSLPLGTPAPHFSLPDVGSGRTVTLDDFTARPALVVVFLCAHCPYVVHVRGELARMARAFPLAAFVAISSNDAVKYPDDGPENLRAMAIESGFPFPVLYDESQEVARAYTAACTPDFFLFDADRRLAYRGRFDDSTPGNGRPLTGADLRAALEAVLAGNPAPQPQSPSVGCSIKWKG
ncbi:MAG: thioredoxin family protein [Terrimicrobiaceae bacterium]|nr:thioredoxin family protein [Terrimicrobiaceae bacterium]